MAGGNPSFDFLNEGSQPSSSTSPNVAMCPQCNGKLKVSPQLAGRKVRCPKCQTAFALPAPAVPSPATPPPRKTIQAAAEETQLSMLASSVTVQASGAYQGRMLMKSMTTIEPIANGLTFPVKTLRIPVVASLILGAIVLTLIGVVAVVAILGLLGINERGLFPIVLAIFSLGFLVLIIGLFAGWGKFLGQTTQISLTKDMPIEVRPGPEVTGKYCLAIKVGRDKLYFMVAESARRELREFIGNNLNKTAPV